MRATPCFSMVENNRTTPSSGDYGTLMTRMQLIYADEQND
jgi:hypothetical protein